ncbi:MAG: hypothetical protein ACLPKT_06005 [Methylocella sp.]
MTKVDDAYKQKQFDAVDRNELLWRALDKAALKGKLRPDAIELLHGMFADKCKIINGEITLHNLDLPEAIDAIIARMPLVAPPKDDPAIAERERIEQEALAGSVQAHGALWKKFVAQSGGNERLGDAKYREWCDTNKAKPGLKAAVDDAAVKVGELDAADLLKVGASTNPWSVEGWNITKQGSAFRADPALAARLAAAAGSKIGAVRPTK